MIVKCVAISVTAKRLVISAIISCLFVHGARTRNSPFVAFARQKNGSTIHQPQPMLWLIWFRVGVNIIPTRSGTSTASFAAIFLPCTFNATFSLVRLQQKNLVVFYNKGKVDTRKFLFYIVFHNIDRFISGFYQL